MSTPIWRGAGGLTEQPNSPVYVYGDSITMTRQFRTPVFALALSSAPFKGSAGTGIAAGYVVSRSTVQKERGGIGLLTIEYEAGGPPPGSEPPLPPDELEVSPVNTDIALGKHPRYKVLNSADLHAIQTTLETDKTSSAYDAAADHIAGLPAPRHALALELFDKRRRGFEVFGLNTHNISITSYSWDPPQFLAVGGYRETPAFANLPIPAATVLGGITVPVGYVRQGDTLQWNGTHFVLRRNWIGYADLDTDIFPV